VVAGGRFFSGVPHSHLLGVPHPPLSIKLELAHNASYKAQCFKLNASWLISFRNSNTKNLSVRTWFMLPTMTLHDFALSTTQRELALMTNMTITVAVPWRTESLKGGEFFLVSKDGKSYTLVSCADIKTANLGRLKEMK
jgi:hypothetical protein